MPVATIQAIAAPFITKSPMTIAMRRLEVEAAKNSAVCTYQNVRVASSSERHSQPWIVPRKMAYVPIGAGASGECQSLESAATSPKQTEYSVKCVAEVGLKIP